VSCLESDTSMANGTYTFIEQICLMKLTLRNYIASLPSKSVGQSGKMVYSSFWHSLAFLVDVQKSFDLPLWC
jgi:hypothetical protein